MTFVPFLERWDALLHDVGVEPQSPSFDNGDEALIPAERYALARCDEYRRRQSGPEQGGSGGGQP
jgi:hypothetical protein